MDKGKYDPSQVEPKWQKIWAEKKIYKTPEDSSNGSKKYVLDMFPYPSGYGLHVGHIEGYTGTDIVARYLRMKGFSVLHPMGWDAFGLPAENYAIKNGIAPDKSTHDNIANFTKQINQVGLSYDWDREVDSSSPNYYKYTQWIFTQFFKKGLAYKKKAAANWCPKDETVLANEQVVDGKCERCGTEVVQKELDQWFFKITDYADRLTYDLKSVDWPKSTKLQQENWIGRKEGINIQYSIFNDQGQIEGLSVEVFTTAPVNFGMTFLVLSPEHNLTKKIINGEVSVPEENRAAIAEYVKQASKRTELERMSEAKEKTGVFTGLLALNPINDQKVPVWIADFALIHVGTGAVQGCPAHDLKDFQFAKKFGLPIVRVVVGEDGYDGPVEKESQIIDKSMKGTFVNSDFLNGLSFEEGLKKTMDFFEKKGWGKRVVTYHLRDWLVSRQRYWGAPVPMVFCQKCQWQPVPDSQLPVLLPTDVDFLPHGESPIATSKSFQEDVKCPKCDGEAKREVDTMDTFVDSSWYFWAFAFAHKKLMRGRNLEKKGPTDVFAEFKEEISRWNPVDIYVGGAEHTVLHLMYARFFWKVFCDLGFIDKSLGQEPFLALRHQGTVLGPDGRKMSKRWNNVIDPADVSNKYGADTLRIYEMFMGPFDTSKPWNPNSVVGVNRFLQRVYGLFQESILSRNEKVSDEVIRALNKLILKVGTDIEELKFNTAVSSMMQFVNVVSEEMKNQKSNEKTQDETWNSIWNKFLIVLAPFAPHLAEELYQELMGEKDQFLSIHQQSWPESDKGHLASETAIISVSINGKMRVTLNVQSSIANDQSEIEKLAKADAKIAQYLDGKEIKKVIYVPGKVVNFVL